MSELSDIAMKKNSERTALEKAVLAAPDSFIQEATADLAAWRQATRKAIFYLRNCAEHHRDDTVLEDEIIPELVAALKAETK